MSDAPAREVAAAASHRPALVEIPAGSFWMGADDDDPLDAELADEEEYPRHRVTLTRPFAIMVTPVTQAHYEALIGENPSEVTGADLPVTNLCWFDAVRYANVLSDHEGLTPAYSIEEGERHNMDETVRWIREADGYRLPTEAEWEYAARAGLTSARYGELEDIAWTEETSGEEIQPVARLAPNAHGLHDMLGGVLEWTWDLHGMYGEEEQVDPAGPDRYFERVVRGGSFFEAADCARFAARPGFPADGEYGGVGIRLVRTLPRR